MRFAAIAAVSAAMMVMAVGGSASASEVRVTYNFTATVGVYPSDDPPAGNQYKMTGKGSGLIDFDNGGFEVRSPNSALQFIPVNVVEIQGQSADFSFAVERDFAGLPGSGTYNFSFGLADLVSDPLAPNGGDLYVPGGIGLTPAGTLEEGFAKAPTFNVTGSFTLSEVTGVPLPASAPMFGAALVTLGAVGYRFKRKTPSLGTRV